MPIADSATATTWPQPLRAGVIGVAWYAIAVIGFLLLARILGVLSDRRLKRAPLAVLGLLAAAGVSLAYGSWADAAYGTLDPDVLGVGVLIPVAGIGAAAFSGARQWLRRRAAQFANVVASVALAIVIVMGAYSLDGVLDGISPAGVALLGAGGLVAIVVACAWWLPDSD